MGICPYENIYLKHKYFRIVTGVAITKRNRMIQFTIAESTLLPYGKLNTTIVNEGDDQTVNTANNRYVNHPEWTIDSTGITNGIDYHTLSYESRAINLDTVLAPAGKLVTGVRFHVLDDKSLTLQIRVTDFDYEQGEHNQTMTIEHAKLSIEIIILTSFFFWFSFWNLTTYI